MSARRAASRAAELAVIERGELMLADLRAALDKLEIPFFLIQGTCLGAIRDRGFVQGERDIDLGCLFEDLRGKQDALIHELWAQAFHVRPIIEPFDQPRALSVYKHGMKADIVGFIHHERNRVNLSPVDSASVGDKPYGIVFPDEIMEDFVEVVCWGSSWRVPAQTHRYLELEYGETWKQPRPKDVKSRARVYRYISKHKLLRQKETFLHAQSEPTA